MREILKAKGHSGYAALRRLCKLTFSLVLSVALTVLAGNAPARAADPARIVMLGDSLTAGYGLQQGDGLVPRLAEWLQAEGASVDLVNAGVSGDTTAGGLSRIDWALEPGITALVVALGGNDMLRGIPPAQVRANLDGILKVAAARDLPVLLVGMKAPANWGPDYKRDFDAIYPALAAEHGAALMDNLFEGLIAAGADPADPASMAAFMQADGIHPNAEGVKLIVAAMGPKLQELIGRIGG